MVKRILTVVLVLAAIFCAPCEGLLRCSVAQAATLSENFETGNLSNLPWNTWGNQNWSVTSSGYLSPKAVEAPKSLNDSETSNLEISLRLLTTQTISFMYKVDSEDGFDFLNFYADEIGGNRVISSAWTGNVPWSPATYELPPGNYTFRWEYAKDDTESSLIDTAWLDNIVFPDATTVISYTITSPGTITNGSIFCETPVDTGNNSLCTIAPVAGHHLDPSSFTDNGVIAPVVADSYTITNVQGPHTITGKFVLDAPADVETFETGDFSKFPWTFGGTVNAPQWSVTPSGYSGIYGGTQAAEAPETLNDSETSYFETTLNIPAIGVMSFWYKVSSEENLGDGGDYLRFYIDNIEQTHIDPATQLPTKGWSGEFDWTLAQYPIDVGTHTFRWEYVKDVNGSSVNDRAWIDDITFPGAIFQPSYSITVLDTGINGSISCAPLEVAHGAESVCTVAPKPGYHLATLSDNAVDKLSAVVANSYTISNVTSNHTIAGTFIINGNIEDFETGNFSKFPWSTGGNADSGWSVTDLSGHPGIYGGTFAAESPVLLDGKSSYLETTQIIPPLGGTISFWYRVSSELQSDYLVFYIDNNEMDRWSGELDWPLTPATYPVTEGQHTFRWEYIKDGSDILPSQFDKAWIDDIVFPGTAMNLPVKLVRGTSAMYKLNLQEAYDAAAISNDVIKLKSGPLAGALTANRNISVTLKGGYEDTFNTNSTTTTIGTINIQAGTVRAERVSVK